MRLIKNIKLKLIIVSILAVSMAFGGSSLTAHQPVAAVGHEWLTAAAARSDVPVSAAPVIISGKQDIVKSYSINEINRYLSQMDSTDIAATVKLFRAIELVKSRYVGETATDTLMSGAVKGMVNSLGDPYSLYMDPKMYKEFTIGTKGSFGGVGIILGVKDQLLTVVAPIEGTPGEQAGILSGDRIVKVDGRDTKDMALDEAVNLIRGPEGSEVTLTISRAGQDLRDFTLVRSNIQLKTVDGKMMESDIGYIRLSMFNENTGDDLFKKLQELEGQGMKAVILDLRNNPGGLLEESVKVANNFVPKGPVVSVVAKDGSRQTFSSNLETPKFPLVVLVNGGSASASEIVAGAVQDTGAGKLIGTKTFGKGSVQTLLPLGGDSAIKLTIAKYFTPRDRSINGVGIEPDIIVEMPDFKENGKDLQLEKAIEVLKGN